MPFPAIESCYRFLYLIKCPREARAGPLGPALCAFGTQAGPMGPQRTTAPESRTKPAASR